MEGNRQNLTWALVMLVLGVILGIVLMSAARQAHPAPIQIELPPSTPTAAPTGTPPPLRVYVSGAVSRPDVYTLAPGSIVRDLVEMAGGCTGEAAVEAVNLAHPLADGMHVHVPARTEVVIEPPIIGGPLPATGGLSASSGGTAGTALVNVNTATLAELDTLPGIGPSTAQKIIDYREHNGPFATIEEIVEVSGIGPAKFEQIKELITVE